MELRPKRVEIDETGTRWTLFFEAGGITFDRAEAARFLKEQQPSILEVLFEEEKKTPRNVLKETVLPALYQKDPMAITAFGNAKIKTEKDKILFCIKAGREEEAVQAWQQELYRLCTEAFEKKVQVEILCEEDTPGPSVAQQQEETLSAIRVTHEKAQQKAQNKKKDERTAIIGRPIRGAVAAMRDLNDEERGIIVEGQVISVEVTLTRTEKAWFKADITDFTGSVTVKSYMTPEEADKLKSTFKPGTIMRVKGDYQYDTFMREKVLNGRDFNKGEVVKKTDDMETKRVELHAHTQYSSMDAVSKLEKLIARAADYGHSSLAITDHGVVQAFPQAFAEGKKRGVKILLGCEAYVMNDHTPCYTGAGQDEDFHESTYVVVDIETTGLQAKRCEIIELAAYRVEKGGITARFEELFRPDTPISAQITELTGISNDMVQDKPHFRERARAVRAFLGDSIFVAHNASFDLGFMIEHLGREGLDYDPACLDTLGLARKVLPSLKRHRLQDLVKHYKIKLENHHRASADATATVVLLQRLLEDAARQEARTFGDLNRMNAQSGMNHAKDYHTILLVKDYTGLKNLYKLVSEAHLKYFYRRPRIPKSLLMEYREGLMVGAACEAGELYQAILRGAKDEELERLAREFDYLEIQPLGNNSFMVREHIVESREDLIDINRKILALGKKLGIPVVATGDVHFVDPEDAVYREILMDGQKYSDADQQAPLFYRTTAEMLEEFDYLSEEEAYEVVVENPNRIADSIESLRPVPEGLFAPVIPTAQQDIEDTIHHNLTQKYGPNPPQLVTDRLDRELTAIINNGFSVVYYFAEKLVEESNKAGYLVGSRGSVGSSFAAHMAGITEVNALPAHYLCPQCYFTDFDIDPKYQAGPDLPERVCPVCGADLSREGFNIPFEVFMGFHGEKTPDIDLNFSSEFQGQAHKAVEEMLGADKVFRAGTVTTIADKTAYGYVRNWAEHKEGINISNAEIKRLTQGVAGIKKTTGQHPGGVMVLPKDKDILDFTPVQYPADDRESGTVTTHFAYPFIHDNLLKLDILGHDVPTLLRMIQRLTGTDPTKVSLSDPATMSLFSSTDALQIRSKNYTEKVGTLAVPEFGTGFTRQMLIDTRPTTFEELVRICGLAHGTDVWVGNAQDLIASGTAHLSQIICARDDIMNYLSSMGMDPAAAFKIMENVRKGKGLKPEEEALMRSVNVPEWYIGSCKKIKYMFPKAHAVAYVMMSFRLAYYKVYEPLAFYATYFTSKVTDFDVMKLGQGEADTRRNWKELQQKEKDKKISAKEKSLMSVMEVVLEFYARGFDFKPVDLYASDAREFRLDGNSLIPPLCSVQGVGESAAISITEAREDGAFISVEDLLSRTRATRSNAEALRTAGGVSLPDDNQMTLFGGGFSLD